VAETDTQGEPPLRRELCRLGQAGDRDRVVVVHRHDGDSDDNARNLAGDQRGEGDAVDVEPLVKPEVVNPGRLRLAGTLDHEAERVGVAQLLQRGRGLQRDPETHDTSPFR
jgi:hypothetical protein